MNHVRHYLVGMSVMKLECGEPFTVEEGIEFLRSDYPDSVITHIHPSKLCLFL